MAYTIEDLAKLANLKNPWKYGLQAVRHNIWEDRALSPEFIYKQAYRQSGRTTRLLLKAISIMLSGENVLFINSTSAAAQNSTDMFVKIMNQLSIERADLVSQATKRKIRFVREEQASLIRASTDYVHITDID